MFHHMDSLIIPPMHYMAHSAIFANAVSMFLSILLKFTTEPLLAQLTIGDGKVITNHINK